MQIRTISSVAALASCLLPVCANADTAEANSMKLKVSTVQPPAGFIKYLNKFSPEGLLFDEVSWVGVSQADIIVYFMSSFSARYEITQFGSDVLNTVEEISEDSLVLSRSIRHGDQVKYIIFVSAENTQGASAEMACHAANAIAAILGTSIDGVQVDLTIC